MRLCEILSRYRVSIALALAAVLPPTLSLAFTYLLIIVILIFVGWRAWRASFANRSVGAQHGSMWRRRGARHRLQDHPAPYPAQHFTYRHRSATLSIPGYIWRGRLSFLGLGIREPMPSWGNMLFYAQKLGSPDQ